jgi:glycerol-3-phosphate acyltransferase PlsY
VLHRDVAAVAVAAGLSVVGGYLVGSIPIGYLLSRRQLRRDLRRLDERRHGAEAELRAILTGRGAGPDALPRFSDLAGAALDTAKVIAVAVVATVVVHHVGPPFHRGQIPPDSAVGFLSDQVLTAWQSAGMWAGLAAAVGHLCPVYLGFRTGQGQAPALGLAIGYVPYGFSVAVAAFFIGLLVTRDVRRAVVVSLPAFAAYAWVAWIYDLPHSWGAPSGPELALWAAVLAGAVGARTLSRSGVAGSGPG